MCAPHREVIVAHFFTKSRSARRVDSSPLICFWFCAQSSSKASIVICARRTRLIARAGLTAHSAAGPRSHPCLRGPPPSNDCAASRRAASAFRSRTRPRCSMTSSAYLASSLRRRASRSSSSRDLASSSLGRNFRRPGSDHLAMIPRVEIDPCNPVTKSFQRRLARSRTSAASAIRRSRPSAVIVACRSEIRSGSSPA
jgi:hypothetical protein